MQLSQILTPDRIRVPLLGTDKNAIISELISVLDESGNLSDRAAALEAVLKRENERTTGIGYGLAIPHGKTAGAKQLVMAAGKPATPIDFRSLDGRPVTFVVMLISPPDQMSSHIQALAKISRLMNIELFRTKIRDAQTVDALYAAIRDHDSAT